MAKVDVGGVVVAPSRRRPQVSVRFAWIVVTPFVVWAIIRLASLDRGPVIVELITATPYGAAGSLVAALIALASRSRAATAVATAVSALMMLVVAPRAIGSTPTTGGPMLKILTVNLFFGQGDPATVVELVRRLHPDVLSAQELTPSAVRALSAAGLGRFLPYTHLEDRTGPSGSGVFSRLPVTKLPDFAPAGGHAMPRVRFAMPTGQVVELVNVHTIAPIGRAVADWQAGLAALPAPDREIVRVLVGDFNASLDHSALRAVLSHGYVDAGDATGTGLIPTWPAGRRIPPLITIDHVLHDKRVAAVRASVHEVPGSDHRALFAQLRLP